MSKRFWIPGASLAAVCFLVAGLASPAADKDKPPKADEAPVLPTEEVGDDVVNIAMAYKLADYGINGERKSPLAVITAAQILRRIKLDELAANKEKATVMPADKDKPPAVDTDFLLKESNKLLDKALELAKSDSTVKELVARVKTD